MSGLFSTPSAPKAPDPYQTAQAQAQANKEAVRESALVSQINQVTPFGSLTYSGQIGSPNRTVTQTLSPEAQRQFDLQSQLGTGLSQQALNQLQNLPQGAFDLNSLSFPSAVQGIDMQSVGQQAPLGQIGTDFAQQRQRAEDAMYSRLTRPLESRFGREQEQLDQTLANRGIVEGSGLYNNLQTDAADARNAAYADAADRAVAAGLNEQQAMFGQALQGAQLQNQSRAQLINEMLQSGGFQNQARQTALQEALTQRGQAFNELSAYLQGAPSMQQPNFVPQQQYNVGAAPIADSINQNYANQMNAYNQQVGSRNALLGTLGSVAGLGLGGMGGETGSLLGYKLW